jgi:acetyl-CoA carboxylase biotin carboxylase subunit
MFKRVLVANRGEIARRVIKTLNRMNIESVALFSEADADAIYLEESTRAICIGPGPAKDSYLCQDAILEAALQTDCEAVHPGFGFLSENALFAKRCEQQKLTFIGPSPKLISLMGDKAKARKTFVSLGVKTLFGSHDIVIDSNEAKAIADSIGYPVLLKARAGGGGKGMRLVEHADDLAEAFQQAQREALAAFGDGELYLEKFVKNARHIEFQILGDSYGNIVCLGERECSIQRKNQKLIEEAPANGFSDDLRHNTYRILKAALSKIGYTNAGTVEFLLGSDGELYFMEMNTRIQVEHPVTEFIFGLDIVEWQLRIAAHERLSFSEADLPMRGAAIECRINAEDPHKNFLPSPGVINQLILPESSGQIRIDTHLKEGFRISPFYDSMLAKVIVHGNTRAEAITLMKKALSEMIISGIPTTKDFHEAILRNKSFEQGKYDCSFIEKNLSQLLGTES